MSCTELVIAIEIKTYATSILHLSGVNWQIMIVDDEGFTSGMSNEWAHALCGGWENEGFESRSIYQYWKTNYLSNGMMLKYEITQQGFATTKKTRFKIILNCCWYSMMVPYWRNLNNVAWWLTYEEGPNHKPKAQVKADKLRFVDLSEAIWTILEQALAWKVELRRGVPQSEFEWVQNIIPLEIFNRDD